jgi:hypothetical protein
MQKFILVVCCLGFVQFASADAIEKLKDFSNHKTLQITYNPFEVPRVNTAVSTTQTPSGEPIFNVVSIFNAKAFINGKWLAKNEMLGEYKVTKIVNEGVFLQKDNVTKFYPLNKTKKFINLKKGSND